ncbi:MAG: UDP-N-acetylmuramoyl-tripeptide--D-alanyl-D-alanine ligase [Flavipsychrobacter sp.]
MDTAALYNIYLQYPSVQTDTRKLKEGDLFFALTGPNFNGNTFAQQALEMGAAYVIIDEEEYKVNERCLLVPNVLTSLQELAAHHRAQFNIPFIAITGSNGKTTTKELITAVLSCKYKTYATIGNLNNHIGIPLTILSIKKDAEMAIIEMGANHQKEIASYCPIAQPTYGLINNCGKAHIEGFGSEEGVRKGKGELYDYIRAHNGTIFRNADLDYLKDMSAGIAKQITYGSANATYIGKPLEQKTLLDVAILTKDNECTIKTSLVGGYNFPNVMAAVAVGLHFDIDIDTIKAAIEQYKPDNSRSQLMERGTNKLILDAYNANPTSMRAAIINFAGMQVPNKQLWLGAMKEMGDTATNEHDALVALIQGYDWEEVLLVGDEFKTVPDHYLHFSTSKEAAAYIEQHQPKEANILVKGSRSSRMELIVAALD